MKEAQLADGTVLEFPDNTPDSVIDATVKKHIGGASKPGAAKVIGSTAARGVAGLVGLPGDIMNLLGAGVGKVAGKILGPEYGAPVRTELPVSSGSIVRGVEKVTGPLYEPKSTGGGVLDAAGQGMLMGAPGGLPGMAVGGISGVGAEVAGRMTGNNPIARLFGGMALGVPTGLLMSGRNAAGPAIADALQGVDDVTLRQAQSLMDDAARMGAPITGAEALAQIKGGATPLTGIQRVVEQSRGGAPIMSQFMAQRPQQNQQAIGGILNRIAPEVTDPTSIAPRIQAAAQSPIDDAVKFRTAATKPYYEGQRDIDLRSIATRAQLDDEISRLQSLEASRGAAAQDYGRFRAFGQNQEVRGQNFFPVEGMPRISSRYSPFPERIGEAASASDDALSVLRGRTADVLASRGKIEALESSPAITTPQKVGYGVSEILGKLDDQIKVVGAGSEEGKILAGLRNELSPGGNPISLPSRLESIYRSSRNKVDINNLVATPEQKMVSGVLGPYVSQIDDLIKGNSENLRTGRQVYKELTKDVIDPLKRSPIGQLSDAATFPQQRNILFPQKPETLTPKLVTETVKQLTARDPQAAKDMTRQFLQTQFDEITQNLSAGPNQFGGAKFAANVAGNTQQSRNLQAAIQALPDGDEVWKGFRRFLDVMEAQGKRQPMGSATEFNRQIAQDLSRGGMTGELTTAAASPSKALSLVSDWWQSVKYGQNTKELAEILTDPMSIERMKLLAMMGPDSPRARAVALSIAAPVVEKRQ